MDLLGAGLAGAVGVGQRAAGTARHLHTQAAVEGLMDAGGIAAAGQPQDRIAAEVELDTAVSLRQRFATLSSTSPSGCRRSFRG